MNVKAVPNGVRVSGVDCIFLFRGGDTIYITVVSFVRWLVLAELEDGGERRGGPVLRMNPLIMTAATAAAAACSH